MTVRALAMRSSTGGWVSKSQRAANVGCSSARFCAAIRRIAAMNASGRAVNPIA
jgi:hypothetical protein